MAVEAEAEVEEIRQRGLDLPEPVENGRLRPDGQRLQWRQCFPQQVVGDNGLPFLIEDVTPRSLRVPHEPEQVTHRNGVIGIAGLTVLVSDFVAATGALVDITGNEMTTLDAPLPGVTWFGKIPVGGIGAATLAVLPDVLAGHRLAGIAADHDAAERVLASCGANALLTGAFRKHGRQAA